MIDSQIHITHKEYSHWVRLGVQPKVLCTPIIRETRQKKTTLIRTPNAPIPHLHRSVQQCLPKHLQVLGYATDITFSNPQINPLRPQKVILRFQTLFPKTLQQPRLIQK